jgi:hypothetical protein
MPNVMLRLLDQFLITQDARDEVAGRYETDHSVILDCAQTRVPVRTLEFTGLPPELANLPVSGVWAKRHVAYPDGLAVFTGFPHFAISSSISLAKSPGDPTSGDAYKLAS